MYIQVCVCVCVCVERERERESDVFFYQRHVHSTPTILSQYFHEVAQMVLATLTCVGGCCLVHVIERSSW